MIGQRVCFILDSSDLMRLYPTLILNKQMDEQLAWSPGALWGVWGLLTALLSVDYVQHTTALRHKHRAKNQHITWTDSCSSKPETVHRVSLSIRYFYLIKFGTITGNHTPKIIHYVHWSDAATNENMNPLQLILLLIVWAHITSARTISHTEGSRDAGLWKSTTCPTYRPSPCNLNNNGVTPGSAVTSTLCHQTRRVPSVKPSLSTLL